MNELEEKFYETGVVPVVVLEDAEDAVPLAQALVEGGLLSAEVTFRTAAAEESIRRMTEAFPQMLVGAGTVLTKEQVDAAGIKTHVMTGIIPLKSAGMARYMNENVPGIAVPQEMIDRLAAAAEEGKAKGVKGLPMKLGMEMAAEMIAKIKDEHLCDGVHIMAIGAEKNVPAILEKAGVTI